MALGIALVLALASLALDVLGWVVGMAWAVLVAAYDWLAGD